MKLYIRLILNAVYTVASIGIILPFMFSASDDFLVLGGFAYVISMPMVLFYANRKLINKAKEYINEL
jgi:hypothetical protein